MSARLPQTIAMNGDQPFTAGPSLLEVRALEVGFPLPLRLETLTGRAPRQTLRAVDAVSLDVAAGETLGLVGESGSGKSTLARTVVGLQAPTGGMLALRGVPLPKTLGQRTRALLRQLQWVAQNPQEALNPYVTIGESLSRPLVTLGGFSPREAALRAEALLEAVRLPREYADRLPSTLSGGEKQRVAIARAFAATPDLVVADEPVSALDVSVQATVLNLINALQHDRATALLFISHDMAVVGYMADRLAVLYLGQLMEVGPTDAVFAPPYHPYTEALLSAVPVPDPTRPPAGPRLSGDIPSPIHRPTGCPFHTRCPRFLGPMCVEQTPPWREAPGGKRYFCHIPADELLAVQQPLVP